MEILLSAISHTLRYSTILHYTLPYSTILYHTLPYSAILYRTLLYSTVLYRTLPDSTMALLYFAFHLRKPSTDECSEALSGADTVQHFRKCLLHVLPYERVRLSSLVEQDANHALQVLRDKHQMNHTV